MIKMCVVPGISSGWAVCTTQYISGIPRIPRIPRRHAIGEPHRMTQATQDAISCPVSSAVQAGRYDLPGNFSWREGNGGNGQIQTLSILSFDIQNLLAFLHLWIVFLILQYLFWRRSLVIECVFVVWNQFQYVRMVYQKIQEMFTNVYHILPCNSHESNIDICWILLTCSRGRLWSRAPGCPGSQVLCLAGDHSKVHDLIHVRFCEILWVLSWYIVFWHIDTWC